MTWRGRVARAAAALAALTLRKGDGLENQEDKGTGDSKTTLSPAGMGTMTATKKDLERAGGEVIIAGPTSGPLHPMTHFGDHYSQRVWISATELLIENVHEHRGRQTLLYISWGYDSSLKMHEAALTDRKKCAPQVRRQNPRKKIPADAEHALAQQTAQPPAAVGQSQLLADAAWGL
ncbi:MAG: hypothetical protein FRX49_05373 [Trebouxia sp. A1-2]|nr:MAG: hypothetical protein FRX49_05373 [Trebouxia sp. A1-2]